MVSGSERRPAALANVGDRIAKVLAKRRELFMLKSGSMLMSRKCEWILYVKSIEANQFQVLLLLA